MGTQLAALASLDQRPIGPVHRSILVLDLEGSTKRTDLVKGELRRVMYDLLGHSLEAVGITGKRLEPLSDRGDGIMALIKPHDEVPKTVLLDRLVPSLATLLTEYNAQAAQAALRMRLRVVVHAGEVHLDARGCYGEAIDIAIRLLDAPRVKKALQQTAAPLVLVISEEIYSAIVRHGYVGASTYFPVWTRVGERRHCGWVRVPVPDAPANVLASPALSSRLSRISGSSPLGTAEEEPYPVTAITGRAGVTRAGLAAG